MRNILKIIPLLIVFNIILCCSFQSNFNCQEYKKNSRKLDPDQFTLEGLNYKAINSETFKLINEYPLLKNSFPNEETYFYSNLEDDCTLVLLSKSDYNGKSIKLYLVTLTNVGEISDKITIAEKTSYPGSFTETFTNLNEKGFTVVKLESYVGDYIEVEDRYINLIDSVTTKYQYSKEVYKIVSRDSVRIER